MMVGMSADQVKAVFDATASTYDLARRKLVPCYDSFYRWALDLIPEKAKTIVDLGAGSGLFTAMIRRRFPEARIHAVDFSEAMLELARERMARTFGEDAKTSFERADYMTSELPAESCAIVSSLSIHHLEDTEKQALYGRIHATLKPRGVFVNADHTAGATAALEEQYQEVWLGQIRAAGATEEEIAASLYRQQEDRRSPVEAQLGWMRAAGFVDVDCWFKENSFAVMAGRR